MDEPNTRFIIEQSYAGHCSWQGSDKEYAICQVRVETPTPETPEAKNRMILVTFGRTGALNGGTTTALLTKKQAETQFWTTVKQKSQSHHYTPSPGLPFPNYVKYFKVRDQLVLPDQEPETSVNPIPHEAESTDAPVLSHADPRYAGCEVVDIRWEDLHAFLMSPHYGATEKEDGHRCPLAYDGQRLTAYNRYGVAQLTVPEAAEALAALGFSFLTDGELLASTKRRGHYTCFDLMEWQGRDIRMQPYSQRIALLQQVMHTAGLIKEVVATPTVQAALANSTVPGLALLTPTVAPEEAAEFLTAVFDQKGEGYIVRRLDATYSARKGVLKRKIRADIDVFAYSIQPGKDGGSLRLALRRPSDNKAIGCGKVRAGLNGDDMRWFAQQLEAGVMPVLTVEYLPKRAERIAVVEGTTSRERVRTDKSVWQCTTEQWGPEKADLIKQAKPLPAVTLAEGQAQ